MHDDDFTHEHEDLGAEDRAAIAQWIRDQDTLELTTVGIDIGSSTSHLLFAKVTFQRQTLELSSRFIVTGREELWRSPILLTPFRADGSIDAQALSVFVHDAYAQAGFAREDIDSGAVILTGEAIKRTNARAIDEIFAAESGKFVCATAGHHLEATLAALGSGATALSARRGGCGLHVDIGGGTTKLALIEDGQIRAVSAFAVGGRLVAQDEIGAWTRCDESARLVAADLGVAPTPDVLADPAVRQRIAERLATLVVDQITGVPLDDVGRALELTEPLTRSAQPQYLSFSGGVSEYLFGGDPGDFGDIARPLAVAIADELGRRVAIPAVDAGQRIRATVLGASQFAVQVSGKTIARSHPDAPAVHNLPVVTLREAIFDDVDPAVVAGRLRQAAQRLDVDLSEPVCVFVPWSGSPEHARLAGLAQGIVDACQEGAAAPILGDSGHQHDGHQHDGHQHDGHRHESLQHVGHAHADHPADDHVLVVVSDADIARSLGMLLRREHGLTRRSIVLDGIELRELDYVDVGTFVDPPGVVPVVIKSLLFSAG